MPALLLLWFTSPMKEFEPAQAFSSPSPFWPHSSLFSHPLWIQHGFHLSERHAQIQWALHPAIFFYKRSQGVRGIKARGPAGTSCETLEARRHWPEWLTTDQCSRNSSVYSWAAVRSRFHTLSALETQRPFELWQSLEAQSWLFCSVCVCRVCVWIGGGLGGAGGRPAPSQNHLHPLSTISPFGSPWLIDRQSDPSSWDLLLIGIIDPNWS